MSNDEKIEFFDSVYIINNYVEKAHYCLLGWVSITRCYCLVPRYAPKGYLGHHSCRKLHFLGPELKWCDFARAHVDKFCTLLCELLYSLRRYVY